MDDSYLCINGSGVNSDHDVRNYPVYDSMENCTTSNRATVTGYVNAAFMLLFFIIGLPWNTQVIGVIFKKKLFARPTVMLLLNLAVNHLLECILIMPITFLFGIGYNSIYRERKNVCQTGITFVLLPSVSIYTVALMSVDRVIYLKKPLTYERIVTPWRMFFAIVAIWILSIAVSIPPLFGFGEVDYNPNLATCSFIVDDYGPYLMLLIVLGVLAHLVKLFAFVYITFIIRKHLLKKLQRSVGSVRGRRQRINNSQNSNIKDQSDIQKKYKRSQLQMLKVFGAIFTVSLLAILPFAAAGILVPIFGEASAVPLLYVYHISYIMVLSKSVIYPLLESYLTHETRNALFKCCSACVRQPNHHKKKCSEKIAPTRAKAKSNTVAPHKTGDEQVSKEMEDSSNHVEVSCSHVEVALWETNVLYDKHLGY